MGEILQIVAILSHVCLFLGIFLSKFVVVIFIFVTYDHWSLIFEIQRFYRISLWTSKKNKGCRLEFWKSFKCDWKMQPLEIQRLHFKAFMMSKLDTRKWNIIQMCILSWVVIQSFLVSIILNELFQNYVSDAGFCSLCMIVTQNSSLWIFYVTNYFK